MLVEAFCNNNNKNIFALKRSGYESFKITEQRKKKPEWDKESIVISMTIAKGNSIQEYLFSFKEPEN